MAKDFEEKLYDNNPRDYTIYLTEIGYSTDFILTALLKRMSFDHVRDALEANELDPVSRYRDDPDYWEEE
tara:strand:+ start:30271 stop:30480 length:210 start_codon:yes stop_codon:yes gene_type:complete